jgi:hypothetical protein
MTTELAPLKEYTLEIKASSVGLQGLFVQVFHTVGFVRLIAFQHDSYQNSL